MTGIAYDTHATNPDTLKVKKTKDKEAKERKARVKKTKEEHRGEQIDVAHLMQFFNGVFTVITNERPHCVK